MEYNEKYVKQLKEVRKYDELFKYLSLFYESGQSKPLIELSSCYYNGWGTEKDHNKCFQIDTMAARTEDPDAIAILGHDYLRGIGVDSNEEKAIRLINEAVSKGSVRGMTYLGYCYQDGLGIEKNENKAFKWYRKSAEQNDARAQCALGFCYKDGIGTVKDEQLAFYWYKKSAEQGNATAQSNLGYIYEKGIGTTIDNQKAFEWYKKSAEQNNAWAQGSLGFCYEYGIGTNIDEKEAFEWYRKSAERNNVWSQCCVGHCFDSGVGTNIDKEKAFFWFKKAAEGNNVLAQYILGSYYVNGIGTNIDEKEAFEWFEKAAKQGHKDAQNNLAFCYLKGTGTTVDEEKAFEWFEKAAKQGNNTAQSNLALCYINGDGTAVDKKKAFEWYKKSAEQNDARAQYKLGFCYEYGIGTNIDEKEAFEWYRKSAEQGYAAAQCNLGYLYEKGIGTTIDNQKAFEWYKKSAEQNDAWAQCNLGFCYEHGIGTNIDEKEAFEWYRKSAEQDNKLAQKNLASCYEYGIGAPDDDDSAIFWYKKCVGSLDGIAKANCCFAISRLLSNNSKTKEEANNYYGEAYNILLTEANNGNSVAINQICRLSYSKKERKSIFRSLCDIYNNHKNDSVIEELLGEHLFYGSGCKKDKNRAAKFFENSYQHGNAIGKIYFSLCYAKGYGVKKNLCTARMILDDNTLSSNNKSTILRGLLIFAGKWGYEKNTELGISLIKDGTQNKMQKFYDLLSSPRGDYYANIFLDLFFFELRDDFNGTYGIKFFFISFKLLFLIIIKNPNSIHLSKKEIEQMNIQLIKQQNELIKQQNRILEQQCVHNQQNSIDRNIYFETLISQMNSNRNIIIENQNKNTDIIIEKIKDIEDIIIPVLDYVSEQKKKLPDKNSVHFLSNEQKEEICARFVDETAKIIVEKINYNTPSVEQEETLLKGMFGEYWEMLDKYTRKSLISAKVLFKSCQRDEYASLDHSGIVIAATSALENELKRRFFVGYQQYLINKNIKYAEWPDILVFCQKSGKYIPNKNFELGSFKYIIECSEKDKSILNDYLQHILSDRYSSKDVSLFTYKFNQMPSFLDRCESVRTSFRNTAAHTDPIGRNKAEACCNTIIGPQDASRNIGKIQGLLYDLVKMTDKFN